MQQKLQRVGRLLDEENVALGQTFKEIGIESYIVNPLED